MGRRYTKSWELVIWALVFAIAKEIFILGLRFCGWLSVLAIVWGHHSIGLILEIRFAGSLVFSSWLVVKLEVFKVGVEFSISWSFLCTFLRIFYYQTYELSRNYTRIGSVKPSNSESREFSSRDSTFDPKFQVGTQKIFESLFLFDSKKFREFIFRYNSTNILRTQVKKVPNPSQNVSMHLLVHHFVQFQFYFLTSIFNQFHQFKGWFGVNKALRFHFYGQNPLPVEF